MYMEILFLEEAADSLWGRVEDLRSIGNDIHTDRREPSLQDCFSRICSSRIDNIEEMARGMPHVRLQQLCLFFFLNVLFVSHLGLMILYLCQGSQSVQGRAERGRG